MTTTSYKVEATDGSGYAPNGLVFKDRASAERYGRNLMMRWLACRDTRVIESTEPVNCIVDEAGNRTTIGLIEFIKDDGNPVDATITRIDDRTYIVESRGAGRNNEYNLGVEMLLRRLSRENQAITRVEVVSRAFQGEVRPVGFELPIEPCDALDTATLRKAIGRAVAKAGRAEGAKGSGNAQKRIRITTS